jgi:hypothetical protein
MTRTGHLWRGRLLRFNGDVKVEDNSAELRDRQPSVGVGGIRVLKTSRVKYRPTSSREGGEDL